MTTTTARHFLNLFAGPVFLTTAVIWICWGLYALGALFGLLALTSFVRFANSR